MSREKEVLIIIDDDQVIVNRLVAMFSQLYDCYTALDGTSGIKLYERFKQENPVIICDLNLPDMTGFDICRLVKSENFKIYFMILTAYNDRDLKISGYEAFVDSYVDKMISDDEIILKVRNAFSVTREDFQRNTITKSSPIKFKEESFEDSVRNHILSYYKIPMSQREKGNCSLAYIYKKMNQSKRTFQRNMEKNNLSFTLFKMNVRLVRSKALLIEGYNVTQVADILGFSSPAHFSRSFKITFGLTPGEYTRGQKGLSLG